MYVCITFTSKKLDNLIFKILTINNTMDKEVKARLRAVVHLEGIKNKQIAEKMGYSEIHVGKSLSNKYDVLTEKFLIKFFTAFPEVAEKHKEQILSGNAGIFGTDVTVLLAENENLKTRLTFLEKTIEKMEAEKMWLQNIIEKALALHPDLAKLVNPFAMVEPGDEFNYSFHKGIYKGTARIAAA